MEMYNISEAFKALEDVSSIEIREDIEKEQSRFNIADADDVESIMDSDKYQLIIVNSTYEIASDELNKQVGVVNDIVKKYDKKAIVAGEGPLMKDLTVIADHDFKMVNYASILVIFILMLIVLKSIGLPIILRMSSGARPLRLSKWR